MKHVMLVLLGMLCTVTITAQNRQARIQQTMAVQEMRADGLSAAHSTIPVGSKVRIRNPANALTIEATIIEKLVEMGQPVIDISPAAAIALDIGAGGPVIVTTLGQLPQAPETTGQKSGVEVQTDPDTEKSPFPFNITINNYIVNPEKPQPVEDGEKVPVREEKSLNNVESEPKIEQNAVITETVEAPPVQPTVQLAAKSEEPPPKEPLYTSPPVNNIQIIPSTLPDPRSKKIYRLLIGTYPGVDSAFRIYRQLQAAGFEVVQEQVGDMCRVFAAGIPASQVYNAAQRLGAIGFEQVWIQE